MAESEFRQRLAAILAADVAGYSRLMGDDERATIATLDEFRTVFRRQIESNAGRVVDMAGDSVLAVFDSAMGAVRAAVDAQAELGKRNEALPEGRRMEFRVGVNSGDIQEKHDGTIYGDGVNVAARLEAMANPGGISVSGSVFDSVRSKLGASFDFLGEHEVKNIAEPVRTYRLLGEGEAPPAKLTLLRRRPAIIAAVALALAVVVGIAWWKVHSPNEPAMVTATGELTDDPLLAMPTGPTVAVLPFSSSTGDHEPDYFAEGVAEDISVRLSKFRELRVLPLSVTYQFQSESIDLPKISNELSADYIVSGNVRRSGDKIRIASQLIDVRSGGQVWADAFDRTFVVGEIFDVQDEIAERIVSVIAGSHGMLISAELDRIKRNPPENITSYECTVLAQAYYWSVLAEDILKARSCLVRAMNEDPEYADGWAWLAQMYFESYLGGHNPDNPEAPVEKARTAAKRAVEIDPYNQRAQLITAWLNFYDRNVGASVQAANAAIQINSNNALAVADAAIILYWCGERKLAISLTDKAIALTPSPPKWFYVLEALAAYNRRDYEASLVGAIKSEVNDASAYLRLAAATAQLGRTEEARKWANKLLEISPTFANANVAREWIEFFTFVNPVETDHWLEGLAKAGLFDEPQVAIPQLRGQSPLTDGR